MHLVNRAILNASIEFEHGVDIANKHAVKLAQDFLNVVLALSKIALGVSHNWHIGILVFNTACRGRIVECKDKIFGRIDIHGLDGHPIKRAFDTPLDLDLSNVGR